MADYLAKSLNRLDVEYEHVVTMMQRYGPAIHANLFHLCLSFLNRWAFRYKAGEVIPGDPAYSYCEMAALMVDAISIDPFAESNGKHHAL